MTKRVRVHKIPPKRENAHFLVEAREDCGEPAELYKFMFRPSKGCYELIDPDGIVLKSYSRDEIDSMADIDYEAFLREMYTEISDDWYYGKKGY
jgi:hypothetical protein